MGSPVKVEGLTVTAGGNRIVDDWEAGAWQLPIVATGHGAGPQG